MKEAAVRKYLLISGVLFGVVALVHLYRVIYGLDFQFGRFAVPMWASWGGFLVPAALCGWAFSLTRK